MLKLHGDGDPTGRGEAFSFIRVSMKEIFLRAGEDAEERLAQAEAEAKSKSVISIVLLNSRPSTVPRLIVSGMLSVAP